MKKRRKKKFLTAHDYDKAAEDISLIAICMSCAALMMCFISLWIVSQQ